MTSSNWAAWVGAVTGIGSLVSQVVQWLSQGPRLLVRASPNMKGFPAGKEGQTYLMVTVTNTGTQLTTLTHSAMFEFSSRFAQWRRQPTTSWLIVKQPDGAQLPKELAPGRQWTSYAIQDDKVDALVKAGRLYVGVFHAGAPKRAVLAAVKTSKSKD